MIVPENHALLPKAYELLLIPVPSNEDGERQSGGNL
jgi:hypothetical protein